MILTLSIFCLGLFALVLLMVRQLLRVVESFEDRHGESAFYVVPEDDAFTAWEAVEFARKYRIGGRG